MQKVLDRMAEWAGDRNNFEMFFQIVAPAALDEAAEKAFITLNSLEESSREGWQSEAINKRMKKMLCGKLAGPAEIELVKKHVACCNRVRCAAPPRILSQDVAAELEHIENIVLLVDEAQARQSLSTVESSQSSLHRSFTRGNAGKALLALAHKHFMQRDRDKQLQCLVDAIPYLIPAASFAIDATSNEVDWFPGRENWTSAAILVQQVKTEGSEKFHAETPCIVSALRAIEAARDEVHRAYTESYRRRLRALGEKFSASDRLEVIGSRLPCTLACLRW